MRGLQDGLAVSGRADAQGPQQVGCATPRSAASRPPVRASPRPAAASHLAGRAQPVVQPHCVPAGALHAWWGV
jgi:hypothetical protein